jgi:hypothetical protein
VEKPSRAIGLKSEKDARGDEPAKEKPPRENEPGGINPQIQTKKCVKSPREDEPGENSFGTVWDETPENENWDHRTYECKRDFWDSNPEEGPVFGDLAVASRITVLSPLVVTLKRLLKCCSHCWLTQTTALRAAQKFRPCV